MNYNELKLDDSYKIENAQIIKVNLCMDNYLTLQIALQGYKWYHTCESYIMGYRRTETKYFDTADRSAEYIMKIMDTIGTYSLNEMKGKYVRVARKENEDQVPIRILGNIIDDKWIDIRKFSEQ